MTINPSVSTWFPLNGDDVSKAAFRTWGEQLEAMLASLGSTNPVPLVGVNATADTTHRLAVSSDKSRFSYGPSGSHTAILNRSTAAQFCDLEFRTGDVPGARMVMLGGVGPAPRLFQLQVHNGTSYVPALSVDPTGAVTLPQSTTEATENLLINAEFTIVQRPISGVVAAGTFGPDRWRASPLGAVTWSNALGPPVVTTVSGTVIQSVEGSIFGVDTFNNRQVTLSVNNPSANIAVEIGLPTVSTVSGTITAGAGLKFLTLTLPPDVGADIHVALTCAGSFSGLKLELGSTATSLKKRTAAEERLLCSRYYYLLASGGSITVEHDGATQVFQYSHIPLPYNVRGTTATFSVSGLVNCNSQTAVVSGIYNPVLALGARAAAAGRCVAVFSNIVIESEIT